MISLNLPFEGKLIAFGIEEDSLYVGDLYRIDTAYNRVYYFDHDFGSEVLFTGDHQEDCINWCLKGAYENGNYFV